MDRSFPMTTGMDHPIMRMTMTTGTDHPIMRMIMTMGIPTTTTIPTGSASGIITIIMK
jgi:hypothetical protein